MATDTEKLVAGLNNDQLAALEAALAARRTDNHPVLVAERTYAAAIKGTDAEGEMTVEGVQSLIVALDAQVSVQGALSTSQLTQLLRRLMVHLSS